MIGFSRACKYVFQPELGAHLPQPLRLLRDLQDHDTRLQYLEMLLRYLSVTATDLGPEIVREAVAEVFTQERDALMTPMARRWLQEGYNKGKAEGLQEGLEQGMQQGMRQLLLEEIV